MNQQQIYDRRGQLNADVVKARTRAHELEAMKQKAERQQLINECAAIGHVFVHDKAYLGLALGRRCAFCDLSEDAAATVVARNLIGR